MPSLNANEYENVRKIFEEYLVKNNHRRTPERFAILEEIYNSDEHFNVDQLYIKMKNKNYRVSRATIYNTIEVLSNAELVRKHQLGDNLSLYEKSFSSRQHDHIILDNGEIIEFCDPRLQTIKSDLEKVFNIEIDKHSLYFYGRRNEVKNESN
ncbi:MAG: transcriptional repressor [Flavobacteriales bacterium]|nr:transcriptional repressor [Flavobacteriales bacterium]